MHFIRLIFAGLYRCTVLAVGFAGGLSGGGRSDYWSGDTDAIVPPPMDRTRLRKRRRRRKKLAQADNINVKKDAP
ncbi:MAG: hypothetical protein ACSHXY_01270 [Alphaproteobacteria bacterium]